MIRPSIEADNTTFSLCFFLRRLGREDVFLAAVKAIYVSAAAGGSSILRHSSEAYYYATDRPTVWTSFNEARSHYTVL